MAMLKSVQEITEERKKLNLIRSKRIRETLFDRMMIPVAERCSIRALEVGTCEEGAQAN